MDEEDLAHCQFVPFSTMDKVREMLDTQVKLKDYPLCKRNLYKVQSDKVNPCTSQVFRSLKNEFHLVLHRAIYSHDWDKLLYVLKKSPIFHHFHPNSRKILDGMNVYIRAMILLFMYHPKAKRAQLLHEYFHMVSTCRTEQEKRALMRVILTLPKKFTFSDFNFPPRHLESHD